MYSVAQVRRCDTVAEGGLRGTKGGKGGKGEEGGKGVREAAHRIDLLRAARVTAKGEKGDASISFLFRE